MPLQGYQTNKQTNKSKQTNVDQRLEPSLNNKTKQWKQKKSKFPLTIELINYVVFIYSAYSRRMKMK